GMTGDSALPQFYSVRISDLPVLRVQPMAGQAVSGIRRRCQERSSRPKAWQRFERFSVFET
ncbi:MAG: hypothetical protein VYD60_02740, partial [Pseudomonadota bacterium]|nr:hypothetical protein [Pseudomonadota bacterium]